ncbi:GNAT family N-acetyltransferase [Agreia pratensis]|uniref:GNAT family N-acetyltransferase n=1 Tax=Agreia pratensis TaxID=150121 RepID=UPI00188CEA2E|nr:GNAT family N-acetyltransferase [Agreia pratensis]MBF4633074.1 GNAT family N-acetyltransferase [Agreia pratensis]
MVLSVRRAVVSDSGALAALAASTFPLACPPHTTDEAKAAFIATHLSQTSFDGYLADPARDILLAEIEGEAVGYTMIVFAEPSDPDVTAALTVTPSIELSKFYVLAGHHGQGIAPALMTETIAASQRRGAAAMWLGVNEENARANRFYEKNGFAKVGTKRFLVGDTYEDDFVRERVL